MNTPTNAELQELTKLVQYQLKLERTLKGLEEEIEQVKEQLKFVQETAIPELMGNLGLESITLADGSKVAIKADVYASIRADRIGEAVQWLDAHGLGDIVKDEVTIKLGRGEKDHAGRFLSLAETLGVTAQERLNVHPQTLKACVREMMAQGLQFPEEYFSVAPVQKATIKERR